MTHEMLSEDQAKNILRRFGNTYPKHEDNLVSEIIKCDIESQSGQPQQFLGICDTYYQILTAQLPKQVPEETRILNAYLVNRSQLQLLHRGHISQTLNRLLWNSRTLVPYYRSPSGNDHGDVDPFEFGVTVYVIERMIRECRTKIFSDFCCVSRFPNEFPEYLLEVYSPDIYDSCEKEEFINRTAIASNVIHYTHGNPFEQINLGSLPILGTSMRKDKSIMKKMGNEPVRLRLNYDERNARRFRPKKRIREHDYSGSIPGVMIEMMRAIQELETRMLLEAQDSAGGLFNRKGIGSLKERLS